MKKIFTLFSVAAVAVAATAQVQVLPDFELGTTETGEPVVAGKLPAGTVLVDNAFIKATTVWQANCGINDAKFSEAEESLGTLTHWIEVRVDALPNENDPYGVELEDKTPIVFSTKADMDLTLYYRTGPGKSINLTNQTDWTAINGSVNEVADPSSSKNSLFVYTFKLEANNDYVLSQKGGTGRFYGFAYTAEGAEEPGALMSWDFTKWSDETVANLIAGPNWSDIEKADATEPTDISKDNCFWQVNCADGISSEGYLMANDVVIKELEGLVYTNTTSNRSLAIAVNYPSTSLGDYNGGSYLWLGSKNINYFKIPGVPGGATIKMGIESHKSTDARGVKLTIGDEVLTAPDGSEVAVPTTYEELEWLVPATAADVLYDVQITNTNGCHIYFITVTAGSGTTAIDSIANDENAPVEYYNLQGVRVANPENGLFIKRQGNKSVKVIVK